MYYIQVQWVSRNCLWTFKIIFNGKITSKHKVSKTNCCKKYRLWKNAVWESAPGNRAPTELPDLYPLWSSSYVCTVRAWSVFSPKHIHSGHPDLTVRVVDNHKIVATRVLPGLLHLGGCRGPLLIEVSQPKWTETSKGPTKPPWSYVRKPPWLSFTQTSRISYPTSSRTERSGPPYLLAPKLPTCPKRSPRPPPPTPPH